MNQTNILLESGTGELEILKFLVGERRYAINVAKTREIVQIGEITEVPRAHEAVVGLSLVRDQVVPLIDLKYMLNGQKMNSYENKLMLFCEFSGLQVAFCIDEVVGIEKIKWADITKDEPLLEQSFAISNIIIGEKSYLFLDFEKIVGEINPRMGMTAGEIDDMPKKDRSRYRIILADDSPMVRRLLQETLNLAGFRHLSFFNDGQSVYDYLMDLDMRKGIDYKDEVDLLITDIEMPRCDGHTLTRKLRETDTFKDMPIIIFSSLITDALRHKGEVVGASEQLAKPEINKLILVIDELLDIQ